MTETERFTLHDAILLNAMLAILLPVVSDDARRRMHLAIVKETLPRVSRGHPAIGQLAAAAENMLLTHPGAVHRSTGTSWSDACWQARDAIAHCAEWRLGEAQAALEARALREGASHG